MKRRNFLKLSTVSAFALLAPTISSAYEYPEYSGPLWIFVHAIGGWDPTYICNYQPEVDGRAETNSFKTAKNTDIKYISFNEKTDTFFNTHGENLLVINGVDAQANNHSDRYFSSGSLETGYPGFGSLLTEAYRKESPLGHLVFSDGGYRYSAGLGSTVAMRSSSSIKDLIYYDSPSRITKPTLSASLNERLELAKKARLERLLTKHKSKAVLQDLKEYKQSHLNTQRLDAVVPFLNAENRSRVHLGLAGYASDKMTIAINTSNAGVGGWDNHLSIDEYHPQSIDKYLAFIQSIIDNAVSLGVWQDTVIVMFSEMGRTPKYQGSGKDHWPVTSTMLLGPRVQGGKVIGATDKSLEATTLNPQTLEVDPDGKKITFADLNQLFRRYSGIENTPASLQYGLDATEFNIEKFFRNV